MKLLKPTLLKNNCLQCGRLCFLYQYCDYCIKPLIIENIALCNYCKKTSTVLIDGHCQDCHDLLLKNRKNFLIQINKQYISSLINTIGFKNYCNLYDYFKNTMNNDHH